MNSQRQCMKFRWRNPRHGNLLAPSYRARFVAAPTFVRFSDAGRASTSEPGEPTVVISMKESRGSSMSQIIPFLWFNDNAEEAVNFYVSIFKNAKIDNISRYGDTGPGASGAVMTIEFQLEGQDFMAL